MKFFLREKFPKRNKRGRAGAEWTAKTVLKQRGLTIGTE